MAKAIICDICGKICSDIGKFELTHKSFAMLKSHFDICDDCGKTIIKAIKDKNAKGGNKVES